MTGACVKALQAEPSCTQTMCDLQDKVGSICSFIWDKPDSCGKASSVAEDDAELQTA